MGDLNRPALAFEYEISLALVNTGATLSLADTTYPAIIGDFEFILATSNITLDAPTCQFKPLACGYNPAAQLIRASGTLGTFGFQIADRAALNRQATYNGNLCVARIITRSDSLQVARTVYCCYWTPKTPMRGGAGDDVGAISIEGPFLLLNAV
jgi:hypothetical protein